MQSKRPKQSQCIPVANSGRSNSGENMKDVNKSISPGSQQPTEDVVSVMNLTFDSIFKERPY